MAISSPLDLPNLLAWYTADSQVYVDAGSTLATNTQTVQQWNDKSGNGYHLKQATSGKRPQYLSAGFNTSYPTVKFLASSAGWLATDVNTVAFGSGGNTSGFFVGTMTTNAAAYSRALAGAPPSNNDSDATARIWATRNGSADEIRAYNGGSVGIQAVSLSTPLRFGVVFNGTNGTSYLNNANPVTDGATGTFGTGAGMLAVGVDITNSQTPGGNYWDGLFSEIVITLSALSSTERTDLDNYFVARWISPPTGGQSPRSMHQFRQRAA